MIQLMEGIVMCFILLIYCTAGIANGPVGLVVLYEDDVQARVVELELTKRESQKKLYYFLYCTVSAIGYIDTCNGLWNQRCNRILGWLLADDGDFSDHGPV